MSNYPPGVTGNELAIAGPDYERETDHACDTCENTAGNMEYGYRQEHWLVCGECGQTTILQGDGDDWDDPADDDGPDEPYE